MHVNSSGGESMADDRAVSPAVPESMPRQASDKLAIIAFVSSFFALLCWIGLPVAIVTGVVALARGNFTRSGSRGLAVASLVIAPILSILLAVGIAALPEPTPEQNAQRASAEASAQAEEDARQQAEAAAEASAQAESQFFTESPFEWTVKNCRDFDESQRTDDDSKEMKKVHGWSSLISSSPDGRSLSLEAPLTAAYDDDLGQLIESSRLSFALECVLTSLGTSDTLRFQIESSNAPAGQQDESEGRFRYQWFYSGASGLSMLITRQD